MFYLRAYIRKETENLIYRVYVTDAIKGYLKADKRYYDLIRPQAGDDRTAKEVIAGIREKLGKGEAE